MADQSIVELANRIAQHQPGRLLALVAHTNSRANDHTMAAIGIAASQTITGGARSAKNRRANGTSSTAGKARAIAPTRANRQPVKGDFPAGGRARGKVDRCFPDYHHRVNV